MEHPLVIAGGPCAVNPEPMARFIDLFVIGDGEEALPEVCDLWLRVEAVGRRPRGDAGRDGRPAAVCLRAAILRAGRTTATAGRRRFGRFAATCRRRSSRPWWPIWTPFPPPAAPVVPYVECVQDRIAIEIMRGCPGKCRFCQSTTIKRPLRFRKVETIVQAALEQYRNTGYNEISLLSLSTSDYPAVRRVDAAAARDVPPAGREHFAAQPADQRAIADGRRPDEHRPPLGPDAGARGRPRRHAAADRQADHQRRPLRRLPPGVRERLFAGEAVFHVRPARRTRDRPGRDHRDVGDDLAAGPGGSRPAGDGGGQRVELRAQAADAVPVERHAAARVFPLAPTSSCTGESGCGACS